jgi:hypothetical protein
MTSTSIIAWFDHLKQHGQSRFLARRPTPRSSLRVLKKLLIERGRRYDIGHLLKNGGARC